MAGVLHCGAKFGVPCPWMAENMENCIYISNMNVAYCNSAIEGYVINVHVDCHLLYSIIYIYLIY